MSKRLNIRNIKRLVLIVLALSQAYMLGIFNVGSTLIPLSAVLLVAVTFLLLQFQLMGTPILDFKFTKADLFLVLFSILYIITPILYSIRYGINSETINGLLFFAFELIYYLLFRFIITSREDVIILYKYYFFGALIPSFYSLFSFISYILHSPETISGSLMLAASGFTRARGFSLEPSHFALFLITVIFVGFLLLVETSKPIYALSIVFILTSLFLTGSRLVMVVPPFLFWFFLANVDKGKTLVIGILIFLILSSGLFFLAFDNVADFLIFKVRHTFDALFTGSSVQIENLPRFEAWIKGFRAFRERPIFGFGVNNLVNEKASYWVEFEGGLHSKFLHILISTGLVGFVIYILFIISVSIKSFTINKFLKLPSKITFPFFVVAFFHGILKAHTLFLFWFLCAVAVSANLYSGD